MGSARKRRTARRKLRAHDRGQDRHNKGLSWIKKQAEEQHGVCSTPTAEVLAPMLAEALAQAIAADERDVAAEALREAADAWPFAIREAPVAWLRARADRLTATGDHGGGDDHA